MKHIKLFEATRVISNSGVDLSGPGKIIGIFGSDDKDQAMDIAKRWSKETGNPVRWSYIPTHSGADSWWSSDFRQPGYKYVLIDYGYSLILALVNDWGKVVRATLNDDYRLMKDEDILYVQSIVDDYANANMKRI